MNISKLNFLLPFTHLKSNFSNFNNPQVFKFHEQCFLMLGKKKKKKGAFVPGCKSSILSVIMKMKKNKKTNKTKTMSNLTLKIVPMF